MTPKESRGEILGRGFADNIIEAAHLSYDAPRGRAIVEACIRRLQERINEIRPKKSKPAYKKSRYG